MSGSAKYFTCIKCICNLKQKKEKEKAEDKQGQVKGAVLKIKALWVNTFGSISFSVHIYNFLHVTAILLG